MRIKQTLILGVRIDILTRDEVLDLLESLLEDSPSQHHVVTVNAEFIMAAQKQSRFRRTLEAADLNLADGVGPIWAAKYLSLPKRGYLGSVWQMVYSGASLVFWPPFCKGIIPERVSGADLVLDVLKLAEKSRKKVFLLGGSMDNSSTPEKTEQILREKFYELDFARDDGLIVSSDGQYDKEENDKLIKLINKAEPGILFVAFNHPKAQYWIEDNLERITSAKLAIGVGGSFEFLAGIVRRAPKIFRFLGIEWLWRLALQPRRLPRILTATVKFITAVMRDKNKNDL